jgi:hypothetical protein
MLRLLRKRWNHAQLKRQLCSSLSLAIVEEQQNTT